MQELFIKLSNSRGSDKVANLGAYAHRAAINLAFDWRRSQKRPALDLDQVHEPASNDNSPLSKLVQEEKFQEILDAIGKLNGLYREALVMRYIQEESYDYIAEQLDKTAQQVRALCSKALSRIRSLLESNQTTPFRKETYDVKD